MLEVLQDDPGEKFKTPEHFYEVIRNKNVARRRQEFIEDMVNVGVSLLKIPNDLMQGLIVAVGNCLDDKGFINVASALGYNKHSIRLLTAITKQRC